MAFWADWDDECDWTYLGTVAVNVHDIAQIPAGGLCYSAILPSRPERTTGSCDTPKIARVRAVLSWAVPPSTTNPDALTTWGNRIDTHVQIQPGQPTERRTATIRNIGGIAVEDYPDRGRLRRLHEGRDRSCSRTSRRSFADGLNRPCPFGGQVIVEGNFPVSRACGTE